jgi:serine O-acetyltransferase
LVCGFADALLAFLFPQLAEDDPGGDYPAFRRTHERLRRDLRRILALSFPGEEARAAFLLAEFNREIPPVYDTLLHDARAICEGDPAANDLHEVIRSYPGFYATALYRLAHAFLQLEVPGVPRILSEHAHAKTGIDIHPGARIGERFCIDHGTGVVIGETTVIGSNVKIYQGVTLGALSVSKSMAKAKRHPVIEDNVIIYAGATILGGETRIGRNSIIGGNVWLAESVPAHSRIYHKPQILIVKRSAGERLTRT